MAILTIVCNRGDHNLCQAPACSCSCHDSDPSRLLSRSFETSKRKLLEAAAIAIDIAQRDYADAGNTSERWESQAAVVHRVHLSNHITDTIGGFNQHEDHDSHMVIRALMYYVKVMQEEGEKMDAVVREEPNV